MKFSSFFVYNHTMRKKRKKPLTFVYEGDKISGGKEEIGFSYNRFKKGIPK